jgi:hypothetical protein
MIWPPTGSFEIAIPAYRTDFEKKVQFGQLLSQGLKPFEAAIQLFDTDNSAALWVSENWPNDEVVIAASKIQEKDLKLLDKEALANKVLTFAEEKDASGRFYINESAERLKALELYAKICGYIGQVNITTPIHNDNRTMNIRLVSPDKKQDDKVIDVEPETKSADIVPLRVKLVS